MINFRPDVDLFRTQGERGGVGQLQRGISQQAEKDALGGGRPLYQTAKSMEREHSRNRDQPTMREGKRRG